MLLKPLPILVPPEDLKYALGCKKVAKGHVVEVRQRVVFGDVEEILRLFGADSGSCINTSYIERINLTIRNSLARFIRKGMIFSKSRTRPKNELSVIDAIGAVFDRKPFVPFLDSV